MGHTRARLPSEYSGGSEPSTSTCDAGIASSSCVSRRADSTSDASPSSALPPGKLTSETRDECSPRLAGVDAQRRGPDSHEDSSHAADVAQGDQNRGVRGLARALLRPGRMGSKGCEGVCWRWIQSRSHCCNIRTAERERWWRVRWRGSKAACALQPWPVGPNCGGPYCSCQKHGGRWSTKQVQ